MRLREQSVWLFIAATVLAGTLTLWALVPRHCRAESPKLQLAGQPAPGPAAPFVKPPERVTAKVGRLARIEVLTNCKGLAYLNLNPDTSDLFREYDPDPTHYVYRFAADSPGDYKVVFAGAAGDVPVLATTVVTLEGPTPPPPPPAPPAPADPFAQAVQAAYAADAGADKAKNIALLAALFRQAAATTANDPAVKTYGDLFTTMQKASAALMPAAALGGVRQAVAAELVTALGTNPSAVIDRALVSKEFIKVAAALEGVKP